MKWMSSYGGEALLSLLGVFQTSYRALQDYLELTAWQLARSGLQAGRGLNVL